MAFMGSGDMSTTVNIGGTSMGLQAAVDQAVAALRALSVNMDEMSAQSEATGFSMGNLGQVFTSSGFSLSGLLDVFGLSSGPLGMFTGMIGQVTSGIGQMITQAVSFVGAMAGWAIIQTVIGWVQQLSDELFNLQVQTQRLDTGWQYLLGGGPQNGGIAASQNMMQWSSQFSMGIPFTRQDLMSAITTLAAVGLNTQQIEQFMPYLSDIAATYGSSANGGQGATLSSAANAIRMASYGISRDLKTQLNISPQELQQYGLQATGTGIALHITDMNSLYRSLENFANAKHVAGASQNIVNSTWWGGWSSLVDNIQNFLLQVGGTNLSGTIQPGSFFGVLQQHLDSLLGWFSEHKDQVKSFADLLSHLLGDVVNAGGGLLGAFIDELNKLGAVQWITSGIEKLDALVRQWFGLDQPGATSGGGGKLSFRQAHAEQLNALGSAGSATSPLASLPGLFSQLAQAIGTIDWSAVGSFFSALAQDMPAIGAWIARIVQDMIRFATSLTPQERDELKQFFGQLGTLVGTNLLMALGLVDDSLHLMTVLLPEVLPLLNSLLTLANGLSLAYQGWATALSNAAYGLQQIGNNTPQWLRDLMKFTPGGVFFQGPSWNVGSGASGSGGTLGFPSAPNSTNTPGGYHVFGARGAN